MKNKKFVCNNHKRCTIIGCGRKIPKAFNVVPLIFCHFNGVSSKYIPVPLSYYMKEVLEKDKECS